MPVRVAIIADPGIDTAFALALALNDPNLEVVAIVASAGNVPAETATRNVHLLINSLDPPRWPRIGAAWHFESDLSGAALHGPEGLGGMKIPDVSLMQPSPGERVLYELIREYPRELTILVLGPCTMLARAIDRDPDLPNLVDRVIVVGGCVSEAGNAGPVSEFHFAFDPVSARRVLRSGAMLQLLPLDQTRRLVFSPTDLLELPEPSSPASQFLRQIVPWGIRATSQMYGIEGFHLKDVLGVVAASQPMSVTFSQVSVDVELRGELTRGMSVIDRRVGAPSANVQLAVDVELTEVRAYIRRILGRSDAGSV